VCLRKKYVVKVGVHKELQKETSKSSNPPTNQVMGRECPPRPFAGMGKGKYSPTGMEMWMGRQYLVENSPLPSLLITAMCAFNEPTANKNCIIKMKRIDSFSPIC